MRPFGLDRDDADGRDRDLPRPRRDLRPARRCGTPILRVDAHARRGPRASLSRPLPELLRRASRRRCAARAPRSREALAARHGRRARRTSTRRAVAVASRRAGEPWFCLRAAGPRRRRARGARLRARDSRPRAAIASRASPRAGARWRAAPSRPPTAPRGAGPVAVGGFAFAPDGGARAALGGFAAGVAARPEVALARRGERRAPDAFAALAAPDDDARRARWRGCERALAELRAARRCRCSIRSPSAASASSARCRRSTTRARSRAAVERIRAGALEKVVLAREVQVHAPRRHDAAAVLGVLREALPRRATSSASAAATARSSPPRPSCSSAARACAPRRSRSPARRAAAPTRPSTTTSASSCCARPRTARSRRSSRAGSPARCAPHACGSPRADEPVVVADGEHPAPGDADPRAAARAGRRGRARRAAAPDAGRRRRAARRGARR